ncbi:MAG: hypothetical protein KC466_06815, partial [Myxococcales bacterium]|nr:hypothetical protein [Myxococcales bacterium]
RPARAGALYTVLAIGLGALGVAWFRVRRRAVAVGEWIVFGSAFLYLLMLFAFWPLLTTQDYMPIEPLVALFAAGPLLGGARALGHRLKPSLPRRALLGWGGPAALVTAMLLGILLAARPWNDHTRGQARLLADVLRLTEPGEPVADRKGETIFRPRSSYYVLEKLTRVRFGRGLLTDDIPERLARTGTAVSVRFHGPTRRSREFMAIHYLPITARLMVAGSRLDAVRAESDGSIPFEVAIPLRYTVVDAKGRAPGRIDGAPMGASVELTPGPHVFTPDPPARPLVVVWARAVDRGFNPLAFKENPR